MSHQNDIVLTFLEENFPPRAITLKLYVATAWMGSMSLNDVCASGELVAELPRALVKKFLADGEVEEVSLDGLMLLMDLVDDEDDEDGDEDDEGWED